MSVKWKVKLIDVVVIGALLAVLLVAFAISADRQSELSSEVRNLIATGAVILVGLGVVIVLGLRRRSTFSPEERAMSRSNAKVLVMMFLGGVIGLVAGAVVADILHLERREVVTYGTPEGMRGFPAEIALALVCMVLVGGWFYALARKREDRHRR